MRLPTAGSRPNRRSAAIAPRNATRFVPDTSVGVRNRPSATSKFRIRRLLGATDEEVAAAAASAVSALSHPVLRRASAAGTLRRETPVLLKRQDGSLAEGIVDLAFREETPEAVRWTVVDFKTDRELGERRAVYEGQVALYARAIAEATGEPAEALLLVV